MLIAPAPDQHGVAKMKEQHSDQGQVNWCPGRGTGDHEGAQIQMGL